MPLYLKLYLDRFEVRICFLFLMKHFVNMDSFCVFFGFLFARFVWLFPCLIFSSDYYSNISFSLTSRISLLFLALAFQSRVLAFALLLCWHMLKLSGECIAQTHQKMLSSYRKLLSVLQVWVLVFLGKSQPFSMF